MATAPGITMSLSGTEELLAAFDALGKIGARAAMQDAMKKGAELTAEAARRLAPIGDDIGPRNKYKQRLRDSIVVLATLSRSQKRKRGARRGEAEIFVGSTAPHAHLVEFGHVSVKGVTRKGNIISHTVDRVRHDSDDVRGRGRFIKHHVTRDASTAKFGLVTPGPVAIGGHVPAHPFMRPAFDATKEAATRVIFEEFGRSIVKIAKRYRRQAERGRLTRGSRMAFRMELGL